MAKKPGLLQAIQEQGAQYVQQAQEPQITQQAQSAHKSHSAEGKQDKRMTQEQSETQSISRLTVAFGTQLMDDMKALANLTGENVTELINRVMREAVEENREMIEALRKLRAGR